MHLRDSSAGRGLHIESGFSRELGYTHGVFAFAFSFSSRWQNLAVLLSASICLGCPAGGDKTHSPDPKSDAPSTTPETSPTASPSTAELVDAVLADPARSAADRTLDQQRKPRETLEFFGIEPGMRVAELAAGTGYTTELLARVVGPQGRVYGHNSRFILDRFAEKPWSARLESPALAHVQRVDAEFETPLPADAKQLDAVVMVLFYHDTVWFGTDRAAMNRAVWAALKPGGIFGIVDHNAADGRGVSDAQSLHRIERQVVIDEVTAAGFVLEASADFLRRPDDARDWNASPSAAGERRGQSDRFVLRFRKPLAAPIALTRCEGERGSMCMQVYEPVCATLDTGVRCVKAPCPSQTTKTYSNACTACADAKVIGHRPGACPTPGATGGTGSG